MPKTKQVKLKKKVKNPKKYNPPKRIKIRTFDSKRGYIDIWVKAED